MHLTVSICTRNRHAALGNALACLTRMRVPDGVSWDVLVADNGSRDATAATLASFAGTLPLRTIAVPKVGKAHAANALIHEAQCDYLLWIDDDVLVEAGWMEAYHDAFQRWPGAAFFGGPITPLFEGPRPPWLDGALRHVGNAYAALDFGANSIALDRETLPYGANWAIRLDVQRQHRYDPRLGRRGELLYAGEEWAVMLAALEHGAAGRWVPEARVLHVIPQVRQTLRYLRRYYFGNGVSYALVRSQVGEAKLLGRPRWLWREALVHELAYRLRRLYATPDVWSVHLQRSSVAWGMLHLWPRAD